MHILLLLYISSNMIFNLLNKTCRIILSQDLSQVFKSEQIKHITCPNGSTKIVYLFNYWSQVNLLGPMKAKNVSYLSSINCLVQYLMNTCYQKIFAESQYLMSCILCYHKNLSFRVRQFILRCDFSFFSAASPRTVFLH